MIFSKCFKWLSLRFNYFGVLCVKTFSLIFLAFNSPFGASTSVSLLAAASLVFDFWLLLYLSSPSRTRPRFAYAYRHAGSFQSFSLSLVWHGQINDGVELRFSTDVVHLLLGFVDCLSNTSLVKKKRYTGRRASNPFVSVKMHTYPTPMSLQSSTLKFFACYVHILCEAAQ